MATAKFADIGYAPDVALQSADFDRQRKIADMLRQQGSTPTQGQMVGNAYIPPSWAAQLSQALSSPLGDYIDKNTDQRQLAYAKQLRDQTTQDTSKFLGALNGTPEQTIAPLTPNDDEGNTMPSAVKAAVPGDLNAAMGIAMRSQSPLLQQTGATMLGSQIQSQMTAQKMAAALRGGNGAGGAGGAPNTYGMNPQAFALLASGDKDLAKLGTAIQEANKPLAAREGDVLMPDGNGGMKSVWSSLKVDPNLQTTRDSNGQVTGVRAIPGAVGAVAELAGAKAGANAGFDMVSVDTPDGPRMMTRAQAVGLSGGTPPTQQQPQSQPPVIQPGVRSAPAPVYQPTPQPSTRVTPAQQQALDTDRPAILNSELGQANQRLQAATQSNDSAGIARAQSDIAGLNRELGRLGPAAQRVATPQPASNMPGIALQDDASKKYGQERAKAFADRAEAYQKGAASAGSNIRNLDVLESLYKDPNVTSGGAAENITNLKNLAASTGVNVKGLGAEQAIEAITNKMALDSRSTADGGGMPGAMSDQDRNFLKALTPGLSKTPEGRAMIIGSQRAIAQRQVQVAQMANEYERTNGRLDAGFDKQLQDFANSNQMFANMKAPAASSAPDFRSLAAEELKRRQGK